MNGHPQIAAAWRRMDAAGSDAEYQGEKETFDSLCRELAERRSTERAGVQNSARRATPHKFVPRFPQAKPTHGNMVLVGTAAKLSAHLREIADREMGRVPQWQDIDPCAEDYNPNISFKAMKP